MIAMLHAARGAVWLTLVLGSYTLLATPVLPQEVPASREASKAGQTLNDERDLSTLILRDAESDLERQTKALRTRSANALFQHVDQAGAQGQPADMAVWAAAFRDLSSETLGATLEPVGDSLRAQLELPSGQGLVVTSLMGEGPAAQAGLKSNDILLTLSDKPLGAADDLTKQLKSAGEAPVELNILRAGKRMTLKVKPVYRVTLGAAGGQKTDYFIGIGVNAPDDTLRAHLDLPAGQGLVANEIVKGSPAEKAGMKVHDVLLELGGKALDTTETLIAQVQASHDKSTPLKFLRAGKPMTVDVTPAPRTVEVPPPHPALNLYWHALGQQGGTRLNVAPNDLYLLNRFVADAAPDQVTSRLDNLDKQLKALEKAVEALSATLKERKAKE
jgi:C-terminal processing protease CtpA/Prc